MPAARLDHLGQVLALRGRHVARAAMRALVVARARPLVGPRALATLAFIMIEKPGHATHRQDRKR